MRYFAVATDLLTQVTELTQKEPSSGDVDVAVPVADWNDDVHVVNLWKRRYKDDKVRNCILSKFPLTCVSRSVATAKDKSFSNS